ncbi:predicted protein [Uncinocarpus reesii 1704]|uniref:Uncharacterized protein n=1 Tax=Uncinocarpus reesii (strain UAMH 1704) TaxID=336963 RepID=C4JP31_UNCRE|nr:uncharacterized protein UREG_03090 [Uncinocarpus reesii 1704]EEP78245.1 predicted protein [Uncinocarpus reesii 1704]
MSARGNTTTEQDDESRENEQMRAAWLGLAATVLLLLLLLLLLLWSLERGVGVGIQSGHGSQRREETAERSGPAHFHRQEEKQQPLLLLHTPRRDRGENAARVETSKQGGNSPHRFVYNFPQIKRTT